jgi:predicted transcriptional regulator
MSVAETSITAYREHQATGRIGQQAQALLDAMEPWTTYSRRELSKETGLELSSICGRVNELVQIGLLKEGMKRKCRITKKTVCPIYKPFPIYKE